MTFSRGPESAFTADDIVAAPRSGLSEDYFCSFLTASSIERGESSSWPPRTRSRRGRGEIRYDDYDVRSFVRFRVFSFSSWTITWDERGAKNLSADSIRRFFSLSLSSRLQHKVELANFIVSVVDELAAISAPISFPCHHRFLCLFANLISPPPRRRLLTVCDKRRRRFPSRDESTNETRTLTWQLKTPVSG